MKRLLPVLLFLAVVPYFVGLGASSIWDANEAYYVETPREMLESGDYINPSFNYEPRFNKPVLSYWIVAGLYKVFGVSVGVQRLAIAAAAMLMIGGACSDRPRGVAARAGAAAGRARPGRRPALLHVQPPDPGRRGDDRHDDADARLFFVARRALPRAAAAVPRR